MEDFKWIFYVLAALYFIFRARKKKSPESGSDSRSFTPENQKQSSKPVTFEDLLKEIQQSKTSAPEVKRPSKPIYEQPKYVDYDDNLKEEEEDLEDVNHNYRDEDEIYKTYERAKSEAFNKPSYEDSETNLKDSVIQFSHFKEYDNLSIPSEAHNIARELQNRDNIKRAIVLSEVLNRRF